MRKLFLLCLLWFPTEAFGQEPAPEQERVSYSVEFTARAGWAVNKNGHDGIFLSTTADNGWVPQVPPSPNAWFVVILPEKKQNPCEKDEKLKQFLRPANNEPFHVAWGCKHGFMVIGGYWDADPERDKRALDILEMYASLKLGQ